MFGEREQQQQCPRSEMEQRASGQPRGEELRPVLLQKEDALFWPLGPTICGDSHRDVLTGLPSSRTLSVPGTVLSTACVLTASNPH